MTEAARIRRLRSIREFAESEIVLATGPHQDEPFRANVNPWASLWFGEIDSGRWRRHILSGVGQGGKTLCGSALPVMFHLFEHRDTVVYGAPTLDMAADKWRQDVLPVIQASRFRDLLPERGGGSKGGTPTSIQFKHGPTLRFMTGGGNDKVRAGFTARVAVITETDGMDEAGGTSRETDKVSQIEARTNAFGDRARVYMECTLSTEEGRTYRELKAGTDSRIACPCPHCRKFVTPEREHLKGWQDAASVSEASERAVLCCPACGAEWTEADRTTANRGARLIHKGQDVADDGTVVGLPPRTHTLGFRFTAINNLLVSMSRVAEEEFSAPRTTDPDLAEKKLRQFYWTLPSETEAVTLSEMDASAITVRFANFPRGRCPADTQTVTVGVDLGKWVCHWVAIAWRTGGTPHVIEYGRLDVPSQANAVEVALLTALRAFRDDVCKAGFPSVADGGANKIPALVFIDARDWASTVKTFCADAESGRQFIPTQGHAITRISGKWAADPGYDLLGYQRDGVLALNADLWKSFVHARLQTPAGQPGGLTLFHAQPNEHLSYAKHMTAEKRVEEFVAGKGTVYRWEALSRNNHFLDATSMACAAGHAAGTRLVVAEQAPPPPPESEPSIDRSDSSNPLNYRGRW